MCPEAPDLLLRLSQLCLHRAIWQFRIVHIECAIASSDSELVNFRIIIAHLAAEATTRLGAVPIIGMFVGLYASVREDIAIFRTNVDFFISKDLRSYFN